MELSGIPEADAEEGNDSEGDSEEGRDAKEGDVDEEDSDAEGQWAAPLAAACRARQRLGPAFQPPASKKSDLSLGCNKE